MLTHVIDIVFPSTSINFLFLAKEQLKRTKSITSLISSVSSYHSYTEKEKTTHFVSFKTRLTNAQVFVDLPLPMLSLTTQSAECSASVAVMAACLALTLRIAQGWVS
jgi:hypothetical protein